MKIDLAKYAEKIFKKYGMEKGIKIICSSAIGNCAGIYPEYL